MVIHNVPLSPRSKTAKTGTETAEKCLSVFSSLDLHVHAICMSVCLHWLTLNLAKKSSKSLIVKEQKLH